MAFFFLIHNLGLTDHEVDQNGPNELKEAEYAVADHLVVDWLCQSEQAANREQVTNGQSNGLEAHCQASALHGHVVIDERIGQHDDHSLHEDDSGYVVRNDWGRDEWDHDGRERAEDKGWDCGHSSPENVVKKSYNEDQGDGNDLSVS